MKNAFYSVLLALALFVAAIGLLPQGVTVEAAPDAAAGTLYTFNARNNPITADTTGSVVNVGDDDELYVQYAIDNPNSNPITITLQHSTTGYDWVVKATLVTSSTTDEATAISKTVDFARYMRVTMNISSTDAVTPHVTAWSK